MRLTLTLTEQEFGLLRDRAVSEFRTPKQHLKMLLWHDAKHMKENGDSGQILAEQTATTTDPNTAENCGEETKQV